MKATVEAVRLMMGALLMIGTLLAAVFGPVPFVVWQWSEFQKSPSDLAWMGFLMLTLMAMGIQVVGLCSLYGVGCMFDKELGQKQLSEDHLTPVSDCAKI